MNVEKYNKPMAAVLGMYKTDFHLIELQSTIYNLLPYSVTAEHASRSWICYVFS
jgi:hypothetical protein